MGKTAQLYWDTLSGLVPVVPVALERESHPALPPRVIFTVKEDTGPWRAGEELGASARHIVLDCGFRGCHRMCRTASMETITAGMRDAEPRPAPTLRVGRPVGFPFRTGAL